MGLVAFPTSPGPAIPLCADCRVHWAPGGRDFVLGLPVPHNQTVRRTFRISLGPGEMFPHLTAAGIRSEADLAGLPIVLSSDERRYPGRDPSAAYAFVRETIQRNIYRVPLP